jgi:predicted nucleotidyltransferase
MIAIERAKEFSEVKLKELRSQLDGIIAPNDIVLTCGSYARREASGTSDIDFFIISEQVGSLPWVESAKEAIKSIVNTEPAAEGAFSTVVQRDEMLRNIGGDNDSNKKITQRMLFLLEGEWLFNEFGLKEVRRQILERYIGNTMTDHQLALFLLNDIIRYYRTIAVDYEFKTAEGEGPKPWAIRNIKLIFSRKLLYASGLFSVAMTADRARDQKIAILERLFDMPVIDRMTDICGTAGMSSVLASYSHFLEKLEDSAVRGKLNNLKREERNDPLFREIKNEGHHFSQELMRLFDGTFGSTHPIRGAVVF